MKMFSLATIALCLGTALNPQSHAQEAADILPPQTRIDASAAHLERVTRIRASDLIGVNVTSQIGENLGQVQDLIIEPATGKIQVALIGKGFMAGLGDRVIPLPWQAINVRSQKEFVLNVDRQKLQSAPDWSQMELDQPDYLIRIYRFYELEPQADMGGSGTSGRQSGQGEGSSSGESVDSSSNHKSGQEEHDLQSAPQPDK